MNEEQKRLLSERERAQKTVNFNFGKDLPAIYQMASALIYPSLYEGFGIPLLEAMAGGTPVITSRISCMPEVGGAAVLYVNPLDEKDIFTAMKSIIDDSVLSEQLSKAGMEQALLFSAEKCTERVMQVYLNLM